MLMVSMVFLLIIIQVDDAFLFAFNAFMQIQKERNVIVVEIEYQPILNICNLLFITTDIVLHFLCHQIILNCRWCIKKHLQLLYITFSWLAFQLLCFSPSLLNAFFQTRNRYCKVPNKITEHIIIIQQRNIIIII